MTLAQINDLLAQRCGSESFHVGEGVLRAAAGHLPPATRCLLLADAVTWDIAGRAVDEHLRQAGRRFARHIIGPSSETGKAVCDEDEVSLAADRIHACDAGLVVAVGAGTVNDVAKLAAYRSDRPYAVIPTAPSMNGYTSGVAAVFSSGVKESVPCRGPVACLVDLDILCRAPYRMIAAGLGDLASRPVSVADWYLSHRLLNTGYASAAIALIEESGRLCDGLGADLERRETGAVSRLIAALLVSGLAMAEAGSSAPASGAEHLISHYLDMTRNPGESSDLHGCQVGVATIAIAGFYERLLALELDRDLDIAARAAALPSVPQLEDEVRRHFGPLANALLPQARQKSLSPEELTARLTRLKPQWRSIVAGLSSLLRPAESVRRQLLAAGAPVSFDALGVDPARARSAVAHSRHIRARYTILDLGAELGFLDRWVAELPL